MEERGQITKPLVLLHHSNTTTVPQKTKTCHSTPHKSGMSLCMFWQVVSRKRVCHDDLSLMSVRVVTTCECSLLCVLRCVLVCVQGVCCCVWCTLVFDVWCAC